MNDTWQAPCKDEKYVHKVIHFVRKQERVRKREPERVFNNGDCGELYYHLKSVFHCAKPVLYPFECWYEHAYTEIGRKLYDICYEEHPQMSLRKSNPNNPKVKHALRDLSYNYKEPNEQMDRDEREVRERKYMQETSKNLKSYIKSDEFLL
ncbi:MAG: hypothetical protein LBG88_00240 [Christensenellaceae bacterium]|jgi:hypothetical protein|nr:hypothetical protein [Christensenellaceae bacterium]